MIDTVKLYIAIPFEVTLTFIQGHRTVKKQNLLRQ